MSDADSCVPFSGFISHDTSVSQITSIPRIEIPSPPTSNDKHFTEITSTSCIEQPPVSYVDMGPPAYWVSTSYHEHQLFLESTPGGTELWTRNVAIQSKPQLGQIFAKLEGAISFYNVYAEACGFEPRKSSKKNADGAIFYKLVVCNHEGFRDGKKRKSIVHDSDVYVVTQFREWYNHRLCSLTNQEFQRKKRHLHLFHKKAIIDHSKVNLGPTSAYRYSKEHAGGYENARRNYSSFGDLVTFDPTYGTNKYSMIFTPFIGVDHHKRSVTFAAALLFHEDEDSFKWVFEKFLDAMGQREPQCIITDQCAGIKMVVPKVFKKAKHRYCMWYIMQKVPDKIEITISKETDFVSRLNSVVWDSDLELVEFERKWSDLIAEHNLQANSWLSNMYKKRRRWITAYYRDIPMGYTLFGFSLGKQVRTLHDKYILMRWTKNAQKIPLYGSHGELLDDFDATDARKLEMCKLWSEFYSTISLLRTMRNNQITDLADTLKQFRVKLNPQAQSMTKEQELEMLLGCSSSTEVRILPPRQAKNKGSGKRMISTKQQCIAKAEKPKKLCKNCKKLAHHDKRNCPHPFVPDIENQGSLDDD
ncbi:protein FAR1-RELATED SEQUENCE 5-like [Silene latifolia]|uniref:protein FAR1-RELATED SEQUENCE 5-like n=1 Tax=Silene latifolia TaxID=37657 RepID=UPI003D77D18D